MRTNDPQDAGRDTPGSGPRLSASLDPVRVAATLRSLFYGTLLLAIFGGLLFGAYWWARARITAGIYQSRLQGLAGEHQRLQDLYNQVVRKTAVTELAVQGSRLTVVVCTAAGDVKTVETPFDPAGEVYVDFVILDGRLWIRRVFDSRTPPEQGVLIDPSLGSIDWHDARSRYGKAVYRQLTDGRWVVTVTGDGSLGLVRKDATTAALRLSPPPRVQDYAEIRREIDAQLRQITILDVLRWLIFGRVC